MFKETKEGQTHSFNDGCGEPAHNCRHTLKQHAMMEEAKASSELEGAQTGKSICELIDMSEKKDDWEELRKGYEEVQMVESSIEKELERFVRDFTTVIPKEKSLVRGELLHFARAIIEEAMPAIEKSHTYSSENAELYQAYDNGFNACRTQILENLEKILRDNK